MEREQPENRAPIPSVEDQLRVQQGIQEALICDTHIDDTTARILATWYGKPGTGLREFADTGAIQIEKVYPELDEAYKEARRLPDIPEHTRRIIVGELHEIRLYFHHNDERGPVEGWKELTANE